MFVCACECVCRCVHLCVCLSECLSMRCNEWLGVYLCVSGSV